MFQNLSIVDKIGQLENTIGEQNKVIQSLLERMEMMAEENRQQKKTIGEISHTMEMITTLSSEHDNKINQLIEDDRNQEDEIGYLIQSLSTSIGRVEEKMSAYTGGQILIGKTMVTVGRKEIRSPLFVHPDDPICQPSIVANLYGKIGEEFCSLSQFYIESICLLKPKYIDMFYLKYFTVYFKGKVFLDGGRSHRFQLRELQPYIEELKKYCNPLGIEITFNGHDPL